ncbi:MAG: NADP oxidoreductase [Anaerolineaceae bacterium]|nr:NADP oxidoreductase [Anaerolineaceae bacterium]
MANKITLATVWLDGCSGCHMSFLDMDAALLDVTDKIDLVYSPLVDNKIFPDMVDLTLVEGGVSSVDDRNKIIKIRQHTRLLVCLGDCAITGNVPAMRNRYPVEAIQARAYIENADVNQKPPQQIVPDLLTKLQPVHTVVKVDHFLPGCPPPAPLIRDVLLALLNGQTPQISPRFG